MPRFNSALFLSCVFSLLLHVTYAQTPEGFVPSVQTSLNVTYGTNAVSPAGELIPRPGIPSVFLSKGLIWQLTSAPL